jgi:hypothetical protein
MKRDNPMQSTLSLDSSRFRAPDKDSRILSDAKARLSAITSELADKDGATADALKQERCEVLATIHSERRTWLLNRLEQATAVRDMAAQIVMVTTAELERLTTPPRTPSKVL